MAKNALAQIQNLIADSSTNPAYGVNTGVVKTLNTTDVTAPDGTNTATKFTYDGSGISAAYRTYIGTSISTGIPGVTYATSVWIRLASGTRPMIINTSNYGPTSFTATTTWTRVSSVALWTALASGVVLDMFDGVGQNSAFTFYLWQPQLVRANWAGPQCPTTGSIVHTGDIANIISAKNALAQRQNLFIYSQQLDAACSTVGASIGTNTTDTLDPWGTNTAEVLIEDGTTGTHRIQNLGGTPSVVGKIQTLSIYVKAGTRTRTYVQNSVSESITVNLSTGAVVASVGGLARGAIDAGNGWWRIWITFVSQGTSASLYVYADDGSTVSYKGTNAAKALYVTGGQYVNAKWPGVYVQTGASPINTGDLANIIPTAQNLFVNSDGFAGVSYVREGVTAPLDATVADPFGGTGMSALTEDGGNTVHRISHATAFTADEVGKTVAISIWVRKGTETVALISVAGLASSSFDVNSGVATPGAGVSRAIIKPFLGGAIYRCTNVFVVTAAMVGFRALVNIRQAALYQGTNGNKALYVMGMQKAYANRAGDRALTGASIYNIGDIANDVI